MRLFGRVVDQLESDGIEPVEGPVEGVVYRNRPTVEMSKSLQRIAVRDPFNQGADSSASYGSFIPIGFADFHKLPEPDDPAGSEAVTDPNLTLKTRRGTDYYKVPSLKGVWYRSMFGHSGWCATLESWFDPRRVRDDYVPTGYKPYGAKTHTVKGHPFGLDLSLEEKKALIVFLKTL